MRLGVRAAVVDGVLLRGDVEVEDGRIAAVGLEPAAGSQLVAAPGLVDLQVNGYAGVDFLAADADGYRLAGEALLAGGVTAYQPTLITSSEDTLLAAIGGATETPDGPRLLGIHLEGPFLSPHRAGAHPPQHLRAPDRALAERLLDAGPVGYVTLAPELPGALELVDLLRRRGVVVSFGHTDATAAQMRAGFDRGVRTVTHLFNAMRPFGHREPGPAGAALARDDVVVQLIVDGHHLADETVLVALRAAPGRLALVTDAMAAAGRGDDTFPLGETNVQVSGGVARREDGTLAGSTLTLLEAVRNLHALGAPLADALAAASEVPARVLGRHDVGSLQPGAPADAIVLDDRLELVRVLREGRPLVAA
ncbi:MAG TPA: N-acetylglucosamine-6-phosphate deacetylase [Gaiellaceae bacterium]